MRVEPRLPEAPSALLVVSRGDGYKNGRRPSPLFPKPECQLVAVHPENPGIAKVSIVQLNRPFAGVGKLTRNTCIVAPGRSDRSPTGTGTCARMAVLHARGQMRVGDVMIHESIIGSRFTGAIIGETTVAGRTAILPTVEGRAWITGLSSVMVDPDDPYPDGYVLSDTWGVSGTTGQ